MAKCTRCNKRGFFLKLKNGICSQCEKQMEKEKLGQKRRQDKYCGETQHKENVKENKVALEEISNCKIEVADVKKKENKGENDVIDNENQDICQNRIFGDIKEEGYCVPQNRYIRVKDESKVYMEGEYIVGEDIQVGEYYFWGENVIVKIKGKKTYHVDVGVSRCLDTYAIISNKEKVSLVEGYMTHIDNIIYLYNISDKLIPGHMYRVGIEIPHGRYGITYESRYDDGERIPFLEDNECGFDMRECFDHTGEGCIYDRIYRESGKESVAITDELVKYVILHKGSAILQEKGIFSTDSGPQGFHKQMEDYALTKKINELRNRKLKDTSKIYKGKYVCFYFSIIDPMVEVVLKNILLDGEKFAILPNLVDEDFSRNYVVMIDKEDEEKQCIILYLFSERKIQEPMSFGFSLSSLIRSVQYDNLRGEHYQKAIDTIKENISDDIVEVLRYYSKLYPYKVLDVSNYYVKYLPLEGEYRYLYYKVFQNRTLYEKKYREIVLQLAERGIISKRWRNEFGLYLMTKSYYSDAIFQYHDKFLEKQSLDIFIPSINVGLEYQGQQHYEAIEFFGGEEGLEERQRLDALKREKCLENGVLLLEWHYTKDISDDNFIQMLRENDLIVPEKNILEQVVFQKEKIKNENKNTSEENLEVLYQYDNNGVFIRVFKSLDEAEEETGINRVNIRRAYSGFRTTAGGYQWRKKLSTADHENIEPVEQKKVFVGKRAINQYDLKGELIKQYESITAASNENNINSKSIRDAANGKQKHAGGFTWKYADEEILD